MPNGQPDKVVNITMSNGLPVPDQDPIVVKKDNQKIRWCAEFEFQITVEEYSDLNYATGSGDCAFRCTTGTFPDVRKYKYAITANGVTNDPELDVRP